MDFDCHTHDSVRNRVRALVELWLDSDKTHGLYFTIEQGEDHKVRVETVSYAMDGAENGDEEGQGDQEYTQEDAERDLL